MKFTPVMSVSAYIIPREAEKYNTETKIPGEFCFIGYWDSQLTGFASVPASFHFRKDFVGNFFLAGEVV
jgi:hypothetical protein